MLRIFLAICFVMTGFLAHAEEDLDSPQASKGKTNINININDGSVKSSDKKPDVVKDEEMKDAGKDFLANSNFGGTGCKVEKVAKEENKDAKAECQGWLKEQKANFSGKDSAGKHVNSVCREVCKECPMHMKDCSYEGVVHYSK